MNLVGENLSYKLTEELQLRNISFNFEKGKLYTILGRTLSGKTTLLKTIAGLLMPDSGTIKFGGHILLSVLSGMMFPQLGQRVIPRPSSQRWE